MSKSVYSVVLSDEVVAAIDRLAASEGTSRSGLIDRVLAQYAGCDTPAQRMSDILGCIEQMAGIERQFRLLFNPSAALLQLKSAVPYKYNPAVKYAVELYPDRADALGELRVTLRSQSRPLLEEMGRFFLLWTHLEECFFVDGAFLSYQLGEGRFARLLRAAPERGSEELGGAIAEYIKLFDRVMRRYFGALDKGQRAAQSAAAESFANGLSDPVARL